MISKSLLLPCMPFILIPVMFTKLRAKCSKIKQPSIILVTKQKLCKFLKPKEAPLFWGGWGAINFQSREFKYLILQIKVRTDWTTIKLSHFPVWLQMRFHVVLFLIKLTIEGIHGLTQSQLSHQPCLQFLILLLLILIYTRSSFSSLLFVLVLVQQRSRVLVPRFFSLPSLQKREPGNEVITSTILIFFLLEKYFSYIPYE